VQDELMSIPDFGDEEETLFSAEKKVIKNLKKAILMTAGTAVQKFMMSLAKEQEVLMNIADMAIKTYVAESLLLRVEKIVQSKGEEAAALQIDMLRVYLEEAINTTYLAGKEAIGSMAEGDEQKMLFIGLKRFTKTSELFNVKEARRRVAAKLISENRYAF
jgi:hypothetical protein